jgi:hypothetical protein
MREKCAFGDYYAGSRVILRYAQSPGMTMLRGEALIAKGLQEPAKISGDLAARTLPSRGRVIAKRGGGVICGDDLPDVTPTRASGATSSLKAKVNRGTVFPGLP